MHTCAHCNILACVKGDKEGLPSNCPMKLFDLEELAMKEYEKSENKDFYINSSVIEAEGNCEWPRLRETIEFCKKMKYQKIGIAFCRGLRKEARVVADLFRKNGFTVVSVICKTGGFSKEKVGIPEEGKLHPGKFEVMCNPIAQAKLLNMQHTEFNVEIGLCVGHDSLFYKYSEAMVTTLVAKDRVLAHNPCGAIYCADGYLKSRL